MGTRDIEAFYPLSPMQQGMLFHTVLAPQSGIYFQQWNCTLHGNLNADVLQQAWQKVVDRHSVLRTFFVWQDLKEPVQIARQHVELPWLSLDWRTLAPELQQEELSEFLAADLARGFDLQHAPLMRLALIQVEDEAYHFVLSFHHLLLDGWSTPRVIKEVFTFYEGLSQGQSVELGTVRPYREYIRWLRGQDMGAAAQFWRELLKGFTAPTALGIERRASAVEKEQYQGQEVRLTVEATTELQQLARTQQVTLNTVVQGAWALLLSRYSGTEDVVFGATVSGRPASLPGVEEMIGLFINTLPVRVGVKSDEGVGEYLRRLQEQQVEVRQYEYSPLMEVQGWSEVGRGMRLFDTIFVFENTPLEDTQSEMYGGLWISEVKYIERNNYSLTIVVIPGRNLLLQVWYDGRNYDAATTRRLLEHLRTLLRAIVANPQQKLGDLSLLTEAERRHLLLEWNETTAEYPLSSCIHHLFEAQVRRSPDAVVVRSASAALSFAALDQRANQLAHYLLDSGIGPQSVVALLLDHSCETLIAILGVLKAGCAYLPLDPSHPPARMAFALADAQAALLITTQSLSEGLGAGIAAHLPLGNGSAPSVSSMPPVFSVDTDWERCAALPDTAPSLPALSSSTAAYLIYTSGSTGIPKGVVIEHASLVNYICWAQSVYLPGTPGDCALYSSLAFDLTVTSVFLPLVTGNTLHLYPQQDAGPSLLEVMEDNRCQLLKLTPSHLALISESDNRQSRLRCLIVGGEALSTELAQAVSESFGHQVEIYNEYGPTEATVGCMIYRFEPESDERAWVPIGRAAANTQIYILDERLEATAEQVTGELYIGGAGVARGYLGRAELTAERFVPDPFSGRAGGRLYRTGDRARRLADGNLEYLGRHDEQVKYHGYRVELNELRLALSAHARVRDAVVVLRKDGVGGREQLVGYYVGREAVAAEELRRHMQERVIAETVPQWYVHLRRLPLTLNGKVNVEALPAPWVEENGDGKKGSGEARTEAEAQLVAIWREVLGREQVRIDDNFFELGGDSILSIQIIARANRAGLQLMPRQLFQHPTVAALAAVAGTAQATVSEQGEVSGAAPLTPIQRWFFEQELALPAHYNQSLLLQTRRQLQADALKAAVRGLLRQHDALRLRFERGVDGWRQWHAPLSDELVAQSCAVVELSSVADDELGAAITAAAEAVQRSLDLQHGPVLRVVWLETGAGRSGRLLLVAHHLVVDGVSWRVLLEDLERGYEQAAGGAAVALGAKTSSYKEWAEALVAEAERGLGAEEEQYWTAVADARVAEIAKASEGSGEERNARRVEVGLSVERTRELLQEVPAAYNTQINDLLLAALMLAFTRYNGSRELLINLEGHGREEVGEGLDVSRTVGWFTSIYPVRLEYRWASGELGSLLKETKQSLRRIPRRGIGYGLLRYLSPETEFAQQLRAIPQPTISFNYLGQLSQTIDASRLLEPASEFAGAEVDQSTRRPHLMDVNASVIEDQLRVQWTYNTNVHERSEIERLANLYVAALEELVEHCLAPGVGGYTPSDFPLMHIEQQQLDNLLENQKVEDIYPLSSTQEGILFHSIYDPELREYCVQINCTFQGRLNEPVLKRAWEEVVNRHSVLRTFVVWQDLKEPVQIVCQQVPLPWLSLDWRTLAPALQQQQQLSEFLAADRARGFDLQHAPLMRIALIRVEDEIYQFVWSFHHLLLDGWSTSLVIKEVFTFYEELSQGRTVELEAVRPYREYIGWLRGQDMGAAEQFWRELLKGFSAPTMLGIERGIEAQERSEDTQARYVEHEVRLTAEATTELQQLARTRQVTLNTVVQGAWALLLSRYSGSEDVVFGATVSGRPASLPGVEEMVGLFINTLPVRVAVNSDEGVGGYLRRLQEQQVEVRQYEYSPLVEVQRWSEVPKGTPLFESLLVFENYPVDAALGERSDQLKVRDVKTVESNNYRLSLIVVPGQELILKFVHNSERYEEESIGRMVGHLEVVLHEMAAQPARKLSSISILTDIELGQFLFELNGNRGEFPQEQCLHQLFEAQVELSPDSVAVVYEEQSLTYHELNVRANQLAHYLQRLGVGPEVMVALCLERSLEMIVAQLAVLKAGGAYVPIDPAYPAERLAWMCEDSNATILLTQESVLTTVPAICKRVIRLDSEWEAIAAESELNPISTVVADNAAYVIYTSGSTGKSKGVIVTHANVLRLFATTRSWTNFDEYDVWTLFHSYAFDFSVWELWGALLHGGRLVVVSYWVSRSPEAFHRLLADAQVTILNQTPSAFRQLMLVEETFSLREELKLRLIIFGGEALEPQSLEPWFASHAGQPMQLVNMYGITETTVHVTHHTVTEHELAARRGSVIGVPISDLQVYLLDRHLFPVPLGVVGEIYVGGPGVARGYLRQPALTAQRFIPHPYSQKTGERLYRSGDLGRYLANGEIEYVGRIDSQVKIRGFRVELGEIELVLSAHPAVSQCVVIAHQDFSEHKHLVSYVVTHNSATIDAGELRAHMCEKLPEYMVPSHIVLLNSFPLTPNGKIDRKALPNPHHATLRSRAEQTLVDAPPLTPAERQRILYEWNDTRVEYPGERKLHEFFEARAEETPDAVAVVFEGEQLSYRELNERANQLAHYLRGQGVRAEVLVGVLMERSLEMVVALYAILKAGGAYVPLEPTYPRERLAFMLSDLRMPVLLTQQRFAGLLPAHSAQVVALDTDWSTFVGEPVQNLAVALTPLNVAYLIYTSGSSGQPKGVMNTHRGICNRLLWMQEAYQLNAADTVLQKTPFSFDVSVWEFFWPLLAGARLVVAKPGGHRDSAYLIDLIKREQVTTLHFVPSMLQVFLEDERARECVSLKRVICSGEALSTELQERHYERLPGELHNLYGPTEAAVDVTFWKCDSTKHPNIVPIGFPIANTQIYLLDKHLEPVPCGVAGELYIGGDGLARGYFDRPDLTAEKFLPDPFGERGGERLYRTGDLASYLPDGAIEYLGRTDSQIKIRGFRVEPGEIEAALNQHPAIINSVVATRENGNGEKRLVGYTMQKPGVALSSSELRTYLLGKLPEHMIPAVFITLDAFPLTPNGKLDQQALPLPDSSLPKLDKSYIPPRTQREILLIQIWSEVLGVKHVGIDDNFFELGGDSILSIKIISRANLAGLKLLPRQLFQHPTVAGLAAVAGTAQATVSEQGEVSGEAPLTPIQRWFFEQELALPAHYNQSLLLQTQRRLQADALKAAVRGLLRQHDALRLRFERGAEGEWRQWHAPLSEELVAQSFAVIELSSVADDELGAAITAAAEEVQRSLDLQHGPVLRVVSMETGAGRSGRLLLVAHHLVVDGVSWRVLLEDLERGYEQAAGGAAVALGAKTSSYREWAEALVAEAERGLGAEEEQYWTAVASAQVTGIPRGDIAGGGTAGSARRVEVGLNAERTRELLQEVPAAYNTQINDVLVTALARTLCWWTKKAHRSENGAGAAVLIEMEGHGREEISERVDVSRTVGWFTSIYPVVMESKATEEAGAALKRVKEQLRAVPRRGLGYGVLRYLGSGETRTHLQDMRRAQVGFNYLGQLDQVVGAERWLGIATESGGAERDESAQRVHAIEVSGYVVGGELRMGWEYDGERYERAEMEAVAGRYRQELEELIGHCISEEAGGFTPSDFPLVESGESDLDKAFAAVEFEERPTS